MKVRTGPSSSRRWKNRSELTEDGENHSLRQKQAVLRAGTAVTVIKKKKAGRDIWIKIPSGWICARKGKIIYVR